ncbi:F-actin-monooxygenase Mical-like [Teleopsis dalmanni]|uniref:F-actin-monooxygenase Mical-like n=1 Tax=Teleopsis dalmanni TaxID=139649 RepID=UPI0018CCE7E0|nr:F-actin-monooxygenase Mical-like [Teleopsis dalmanni]
MNTSEAYATKLFDEFCNATTSHQIFGIHKQICDDFYIRPSVINEFLPKIKKIFNSWKARNLWNILNVRTDHTVYENGNACSGTRVLVVGAGPCGLRTAIEAQMLGAKVVVIEKRNQITRNNVLRLWPFVITDLRNLAAKTFYGKFCLGSINHVSTRQLQCILLKIALLLGVEVHDCVAFEDLIEPCGDGCGWKASVVPKNHVVSQYEFDVLVGAAGTQFILKDFTRKALRGQLAIAITANFVNQRTEAETRAEEISGVARPFRQAFFKDLCRNTNIDLENIVYYKNETHYFVMTAKKQSLIDEGVILKNFVDPVKLLAGGNINREKLYDYARRAAEYSTHYRMPNLTFATNHYGKPDVAIFDFTSMYAAESSCLAKVRNGFRLLECLVGDSLLEPFWPTGSGIARGFLSSMDAAYAIKLWSDKRKDILQVLSQRESIYRLLNQATTDNLRRDINAYTLDPVTRYPNLNLNAVKEFQVEHLLSTYDTAILESTEKIDVIESFEVASDDLEELEEIEIVEPFEMVETFLEELEDVDVTESYEIVPTCRKSISTTDISSIVEYIPAEDSIIDVAELHDRYQESTELDNIELESAVREIDVTESIVSKSSSAYRIDEKVKYKSVSLVNDLMEQTPEFVDSLNGIPEQVEYNSLNLENIFIEQVPKFADTLFINEEHFVAEKKDLIFGDLSDLIEPDLGIDEEDIESSIANLPQKSKSGLYQGIKDIMGILAKPMALLFFTLCCAYYMWK